MAKSNAQLEADVAALMESLGVGKADVIENLEELPALNKFLVLSAANFVLKVQENLKKAKKIDTGRLSNSISQGDVIVDGTGLSITVGYDESSEASKYADFVNMGVKGAINKRKAPNSPYSFKNPYPSKKMAMEIAKWYNRNGINARQESNRTNRSALQRKRKRLSSMVSEASSIKSLAYATAASIKRKGIGKTGFFDKAVESSFNEDFTQAIANITGLSVALNITKKYGDNNK